MIVRVTGIAMMIPIVPSRTDFIGKRQSSASGSGTASSGTENGQANIELTVNHVKDSTGQDDISHPFAIRR